MLKEDIVLNNNFLALEHANIALNGMADISEIAATNPDNTTMLRAAMEGIMCQYGDSDIIAMETGIVSFIKTIVAGILHVFNAIVKTIASFIKRVVELFSDMYNKFVHRLKTVNLQILSKKTIEMTGKDYFTLDGKEIKEIEDKGYAKFISTSDGGKHIHLDPGFSSITEALPNRREDITGDLEEFHVNMSGMIYDLLGLLNAPLSTLVSKSATDALTNVRNNRAAYIDKINLALISKFGMTAHKDRMPKDFYTHGQNGCTLAHRH